MFSSFVNYPLKLSGLILLIILIFAGIVLFYSEQNDRHFEGSSTETSVFEIAQPEINEPIQPIPLDLPLNPQKINLGYQLFFDTRLSKNNQISCATCHDLNRGGIDGLAVSIGINHQRGMVNTPTVFNSGFNFRQFWDGRAATLEDQIELTIHKHPEMGSSWSDMIENLKQSPDYVRSFQTLYPEGMTSETIKNAIATFEKSLITPNSRFDQFLRGDEKALSSIEKDGYKRFKSYGCVSCHQGMNVGGNMFQGLGIFGNYFQDRGNITQADLGRYNITRDDRDRSVFKVPSLRNVVLTAPYFHDGSIPTLAQAVQIMGRYQLGRELSEEDIHSIVKFLKTLTGEYSGKFLN